MSRVVEWEPVNAHLASDDGPEEIAFKARCGNQDVATAVVTIHETGPITLTVHVMDESVPIYNLVESIGWELATMNLEESDA